MQFKSWYFKTFHLQEIADSKLLQILFYGISLSFFITFYEWIEWGAVSLNTFLNGSNVCPPYFKTCGEFYFFQNLPWGYSSGIFYVLLFLILGYGVISALKKDWVSAHLSLLIPFLWKVIWVFFLTYGTVGNFDYYDMILAFVFLFLPYKEYFAKVAFVLLYFLASTIKFDEGWIFGNYFSSLITGAPIIPKPFVPFFTNLVILMQIVGVWFLFSKHKITQKMAFIYFLCFHIYSGFIVNYRYISISIPALVLLFGNLSFIENKKFEILKITKKTIWGYAFLLLLLCGQMVGPTIKGDQKKTLEGNYWGMFMFEASHQCVSTVTVFREGQTYESKSENHIANNRCDPYIYWYKIKTQCERDSKIEKVRWTFDHSINGNSYERIVDTQNACELSYKTFSHNDWIKVDGESAILDTPVYKTSYSFFIDEKKLGIPATPIVNEQLLKSFVLFYKTLWVLTLVFILFKLFSKTFRD